MIEPSLATIEQPTRDMGARAMEILQALCQSTPVPSGVHLLQHQFRKGGSIASAPTESIGGTANRQNLRIE